ncbi:MAG: hypothetical protein KDC39_00860 [Actinobacteria bacterium]|nr:hypothetical protein [Actinomycetota bacterium]
MAKAILGHTSAADVRLAAEIRRLRRRVLELEAELAATRAQLAEPLILDEMETDLRTPAAI